MTLLSQTLSLVVFLLVFFTLLSLVDSHQKMPSRKLVLIHKWVSSRTSQLLTLSSANTQYKLSPNSISLSHSVPRKRLFLPTIRLPIVKFSPPYKFLFLTLLFTKYLNHFLEFYLISCGPSWPQTHHEDETVSSFQFWGSMGHHTQLHFQFETKRSSWPRPPLPTEHNRTVFSIAFVFHGMLCTNSLWVPKFVFHETQSSFHTPSCLCKAHRF